MAQDFHDKLHIQSQRVEYVGNYTIARVSGTVREGSWVSNLEDAIGVAKYNPNDARMGLPYSRELGKQIALGRAKKALLEKLRRDVPLPFAA